MKRTLTIILCLLCLFVAAQPKQSPQASLQAISNLIGERNFRGAALQLTGLEKKIGTTALKQQFNYRYIKAKLYRNDGRYPEAIVEYEAAKALLKNDPLTAATINSDLADMYIETSDFPAAEKVLQPALQYFRVNKHQANYLLSLPILGKIYVNSGQYLKAAEIYLEVLRAYEKEGTNMQKGTAYARVGSAYDYAEIWDKAAFYYEKALQFRTLTKDTVGLMNTYNNLGIVKKNQGNFAEAIQLYDKSYQLAKSSGREAQMINPLINKGVASRFLKRYDDAIRYYSEALKVAEKYKRESQTITILNNLGILYNYTGKYKEAQPLLKRAVEFAEAKGTLEDKVQFWQNYAYSLNGLQVHPDSYDALLKSFNYSDSLYQTENARAMTEMSTKYETEKKEQQINLLNAKTKLQQLNIFNQNLMLDKQRLAITNKDLEINNKNLRIQKADGDIREKILETRQQQQKITTLNQQNTIQQLQIGQRNVFLGVAAGLLVFGALIAYLIYNRRKLRESARLQFEINKQQELAAREVLNAEERERRRIAGDLHDGVGQLLSAALMNLNGLFEKVKLHGIDDQLAERSLALVSESYDEMRAISHQMMPNALIKAGLASAVKEFLDKIDESKIKISLEAEGLNERLDEQTETVLYRVIQETVNNVIKHARATRLTIQLTKDEEGISATIEDNGRGFDTSKIGDSSGIGLRNIISRVDFLKGTVDFDSAPGRGTVVAIHIPG